MRLNQKKIKIQKFEHFLAPQFEKFVNLNSYL